MNEPLWKLWRNPILRRFATARLRWTSLLAWSVVLQALAAFFWLTIFFVYRRQQGFSAADSAVRAWSSILIMQGVLWLMKGTFSVATGIAREGVEGLTEAQILTPLSSWHKTVGYLLGLPILETVLVLSLLPWTAASVLFGHIPAAIVIRIHLLLVTAALLHHALGLVAGTVIRQKIVAGTVSQVIVILLHGVVPFFASLGLGPLGHLGVGSGISFELRPLLQNSSWRGVDPAMIYAFSHIRFFRWEFTLTGYQWSVMTIMLGVLLTILWRRWQRSTAHLFSKAMAVGFFAWILVLSLGEIVPLLQDPKFLQSRHLSGNAGVLQMAGASQPVIALLWAGGFGIVGLLTAMLLSSSIAPTLDQHWRALRGAARSARARVPWADDARSAVPWSIALAGVLVAGWYYLVRQLFDTPLVRVIVTPLPAMPYLLGAAIVVPLLVWTILLEWRGARFASMAAFVVWVLPLMVAIVSIISGVDPVGWPRWFFGASGLTLPFFALFESFGGLGKAFADSGKSHQVWMVSIISYSVLAVVFYICLRRAQKPEAGVRVATLPVGTGLPQDGAAVAQPEGL